MKVVALEKGFYNGYLVEKGEVFEADAKAKAKWFRPATKDEAAVKESATVTEEKPLAK